MPVLVDTAGVAREVPADLVEAALGSGWTAENTTDRLSRVAGEVREEEYGGVGGTIAAGAAGVARGLTLGGSDAVARALYGDQAAVDLEGYRDVNPYTSGAGEIAGLVLPTIVTAGTATPAGLASALGRGVAARVGERTLAARVGGQALGGLAEGTLGGLGQGITELSLSTDPLTVERAASVLSSNALFGGATGGVTGGALAAAGEGLASGKRILDRAIERQAAERAALVSPDAAGSLDIDTLLRSGDVKALKAAQAAEIDAIEKSRAPMREQFVKDLAEADKLKDAEHLWAITTEHATDTGRKAGKVMRDADVRLRDIGDNPTYLRDNPKIALKGLQQRQHALDLVEGTYESDRYLWERSLDPDQIRREIRNGTINVGDRAPIKMADGTVKIQEFTEAGLDFQVERELIRREAEGMPSRLSDEMALRIATAKGRNERLIKSLADIVAEPTSDRLTAINNALTAPASPGGFGARQLIEGAATVFGGPLGAAAAVGSRVVGGFRKAAEAVTERATQAASGFLGVAERGARAAAPVAPIVATKILAGLRYSDGGNDEPARSATRLPELFKLRTDEIKAQTVYDETGTPRMRPEARAKIADRLAPIAAVDPILADRMETSAAKRLEYLSSIIPRRPDLAGYGMENWQPSDMAMRAWARTANALEDPVGVLERASSGVVTPEEAAALRAVYPEELNAFTQHVMGELSNGKKLPFANLLALSVLTGQPMTPALDPSVLGALQAQFTAEPGSAGGSQAPRAPQTGSMKKLAQDAKTPAQQRQER